MKKRAGTNRRRAVSATFVIAAAMLAVLAQACAEDDDAAPITPAARPTRAAVPTSTGVPGVERRALLQGTLTLDGAPLESQFLGVRVVRDGLVAACQDAIPTVRAGQYEIPVAADAEVRGCGAPGAELLLWTFVGDVYHFATTAAPWPGAAVKATFDTAFSSSDPAGASLPVTEFKGHLFDHEGNRLPGGTVVEAMAGDVRCGITSLRPGDATEGYYTLIVAGPASVPGCAGGATLTFRLDGKAAAETAVNDLGAGSQGHELDLTLK